MSLGKCSSPSRRFLMYNLRGGQEPQEHPSLQGSQEEVVRQQALEELVERVVAGVEATANARGNVEVQGATGVCAEGGKVKRVGHNYLERYVNESLIPRVTHCFTCLRKDGVCPQLRCLLCYRLQLGLGLLASCFGWEPRSQCIVSFDLRRGDAHGLHHHLSRADACERHPPSALVGTYSFFQSMYR